MEALFRDIRHGIRMLFRNPGFASIAILSLALGIGANTAIFSVVNAFLFRPLQFESPEQLVHLWQTEVSGEFVKAAVGYNEDQAGNSPETSSESSDVREKTG